MTKAATAFADSPAVSSTTFQWWVKANGSLEIVYIGTDNNLYHNFQSPNSPGGWNGQVALGGAAKSLVIANNADGRLEIVYIGTDNNLYHNFQSPNSPGGWNGQAALGGAALSVVIANN
ncbi:MAG TPA: hypothetical protein VG488_13300 [Candidatus Angelobacter sp.]|nr:hypothetical protein [Candidatus Angelobacter sp.]